MKKTIIMLCAAVMLVGAIFAEAPELKNMMPNSWKKLTRLSEAEERAFLQNETVRSESQKWIDEEFSRKKYNKVNIRVYSETDSGLEFHRVLICNDDIERLANAEYRDKTMTEEEYWKFYTTLLIQIVFMQDKENNMREIIDLSYHEFSATQDKWSGFIFGDLMIKPLNKEEIGFFVTEVGISFYVEMREGYVDVIYRTCNNQLIASNSAQFSKCNINDNIESAWYKEKINIQASSCLRDAKCPLRYSIQNAFDGDPATSYVENTEDDLMEMDFQHLKEYNVTGMAIINGYASSENLYLSNNRIASYKYNSKGTPVAQGSSYYINEIILVDKNLSYQIFTDCFPNHPYAIASGVKKIYKGEKYNDTCLAEVNLIQSDGNFLFGDIK